MPIYTTLPGDLQSMDSQGMGEGLPIWRRFAVIIRSRRIDINEVMRGYDNVDRGFFEQNQFRRALCDCMGNQWTELAMTSAEFNELAEPYYTKKSTVVGAPPPMIQWRHFARDMQKLADDILSDKDIAAAERLDGTNSADINNTRNDGCARPPNPTPTLTRDLKLTRVRLLLLCACALPQTSRRVPTRARRRGRTCRPMASASSSASPPPPSPLECSSTRTSQTRTATVSWTRAIVSVSATRAR